MKLIDLHVHSTASDGTLSPQEIALYAKAKGLSAIALTDHDTVAGVNECMKKGLEIGVIVIPGIECSADYYGKELHILGYYIDPDSSVLQNKLKELIDGRSKRNLKMLDKLTELGCPLTLEDLEVDCVPDTVFTRAHIANALLRKGYITERKEAFSKYIGSNCPAYIPREKFTVKACIDMIHEAGGLAVLAHPMLYGYNRSDVTNLLRGLALEGLDGVECVYSTHSSDDVAHLLQVCLQLKLFPTGGSDFHGENKPQIDLGSGYGHLKVPFDILEAMRKCLGMSY